MSCSESEVYIPCGCKAHLFKEDPRASLWAYALGCLEFPLISPISHYGNADGMAGSRKFLKGDWAALSDAEKARMTEKLIKKFGISLQEFESQMKSVGYMPIKDENIILVICQKHSRMMM